MRTRAQAVPGRLQALVRKGLVRPDRRIELRVGHEVQLLRADPQHAGERHRLVLGGPARVLFLGHPYLRFAFLSAAWP